MTTQTKNEIRNGVNVTALKETIEAVQEDPTIAKFNFRATNRWINGSLNRTTIKSFRGANQDIDHKKAFVLDCGEPELLLGDDTAPNPVEYLITGLVGCLTTSLVYHAAARGIDVEEIESSINGNIDLQGFLGLRDDIRKGYQNLEVNFKIKADADTETLKELAGFSVVYDSVKNGVPINVNIEKT